MAKGTIYQAGALRLDLADERAFLNGAPLSLGHKPFLLLATLMQSPERMLTKDELIEIVWDGRIVSDGVLTTAMRELRRALSDNARQPKFIQTVHGRGYRFLLAVELEQAETHNATGAASTESTNSAPDAETDGWTLTRWGTIGAVLAAVALLILTLDRPSNDPARIETITVPAELGNSVVVIPFSDLSPDGDHAWFAGGLTQELLTTLGQSPDLAVVSLDPSARNEATALNGAELARQLGVLSAVEGSVRRVDGRIRVSVQLSRAKDGVVVWSQSYDRADSEIISIQEDLAYELANSLTTVTDTEQLRAMSKAGTRSVEAYQALLSGHFYLNQQYATGDANYRRRAYEEYERARSIDPGFSEAHWLAARYWRERSTYIVPPSEARQYSVEDITRWFEERVEQAIETAPTRLERSKYLAAQHMHRLEVASASRLLQNYLEQRPNDAYAWVQLAEASTIKGDYDIGRRAAQRIAELSEQQSIYRSRVIPIFLWVRDIDGSVAQAERLLSAEPDNAFIQYHAHRTFLWAGQFDRARQLIEPINQGALPAHNRSLARIRQACADREIANARAEYIALLDNERASRASVWLAGHAIGEREAANAGLKNLDQDGHLHQLAAWLRYPHFEAVEFPKLSQKLAFDGIRVSTPLRPPFECDRP
ncbi:MAG: winged helix-turn-helix domain-containing protein [Pseudomonadota bacterium]